MVRTNDRDREDTPPNVPTRPEPLVDPRTWDEDERPTPVRPHRRPAPVVVRAGDHVPPPPLPGPAPRSTPVGTGPRTLAALGMRRPTPLGLGHAPDPFPLEEAPTPTMGTPEAQLAREAARLVRNWRACSPEKRQLISAFALQYRDDAEGLERTT